MVKTGSNCEHTCCTNVQGVNDVHTVYASTVTQIMVKGFCSQGKRWSPAKVGVPMVLTQLQRLQR